MNQLSAKDLELAKKHAGLITREAVSKIPIRFEFSTEQLAALLAERDAEHKESGCIFKSKTVAKSVT